MNELTERFDSAKFQVIGVPCNQFGHQCIGTGPELLNILKYVRPGGLYEPNFPLTEKMEVVGANTHPLWKILRSELPYSSDRTPDLDMTAPYGTMTGGSYHLPVTPSDIQWNFEKFLIDQNGIPVKRFSPKYETIKIASDIEALL